MRLAVELEKLRLTSTIFPHRNSRADSDLPAHKRYKMIATLAIWNGHFAIAKLLNLKVRTEW